MNTASINFAGDRPVRREIDVAWIHGSPSAEQNIDPAIQVFDYDEHTVILRQSMSIDREAPFLFLLFGNTRAVLIDTGATASADVFPLRRAIRCRQRSSLELPSLRRRPDGQRDSSLPRLADFRRYFLSARDLAEREEGARVCMD